MGKTIVISVPSPSLLFADIFPPRLSAICFTIESPGPVQTVTGVVRSIEDYGIFVELTPNLAGLAEPRADVALGRQASVYIKSIIRGKMKIKLIIIDSFESRYAPEIKYFYTGDRLDNWDYSPTDCCKHISAKFCG